MTNTDSTSKDNSRHTSINQRYLKIVYDYLGEKAASLFEQFYAGFPEDQQRSGAYTILSSILGKEKADELFEVNADLYYVEKS